MIDMLREIIESLVEAHAKIARLDARHERMFRKGTVTDVDPAKQLYRQEIGVDENGDSVKSPWIPYSQIAGARMSHSPPSVGQQFVQIAPDGDFEQAFGVPLTWSNAVQSPSQRGDEDVDIRGKSRDQRRADFRLIEVGGASVRIEDGKITLSAGGQTFVMDGNAHFNGGSVDHDGHAIDSTHMHTGVTPGGALTGAPQ